MKLLSTGGFAVVALAAWSCAGCASDGAVRLARCFEQAAMELRASNEATVVGSCDPGLGAAAMGSVVVALPAAPVSSAQLAGLGLRRDEINAVSRLQIGDDPVERINILPAGRRPRASRTTYQQKFVRTQELLACRLEGSTVSFTLAKAGSAASRAGRADTGELVEWVELVGLSAD